MANPDYARGKAVLRNTSSGEEREVATHSEYDELVSSGEWEEVETPANAEVAVESADEDAEGSEESDGSELEDEVD